MEAAPDGLDIGHHQPAFVAPIQELIYRALHRADPRYFLPMLDVNSNTLWD